MRLAKSFYYAFKGIAYCIRHERNFKIHLVCALAACLAGWYVGLSPVEWMILILTMAFVIAFEIVNTALERTIDLVSPDFHPMAKIVKDTAAGAVLVVALAALVVGYWLFVTKFLR